MNIKKKLSVFIDNKKKQMQHGIEISEQLQAEKIRKKKQKARYYEPGTIKYGLSNKQNPLDFMKDAYERRKSKR